MSFDAPRLKGLITDWGGVLTTPLRDGIYQWLAAERIDVDGYQTVMRAWLKGAYRSESDGVNPVHGLEDGSLDPAEFERLLAAELRTVDGAAVPAEGLLGRMFAAFEPVEAMYETLRRARAAGVRTCLLSNSWGNAYPREHFAELFNGVVISAEVRLRKPDPAIFRHALELLGLEAAECAFVDDVGHNVRAAERLGMVGVHHTDTTETLARLDTLFAM